MQKRRVWRYKCDYCKKSNCSGSSISKHEARCTLNPNRTCGVCRMLKHAQPNLAEVIAALPRPTLKREGLMNDWLEWPKDVDEELVLTKLRKLTGRCPACMLAALRQAKIPVPMLSGFDYTAETKAILQQINEDREYGRSEADDYAAWAS